MPKKQPVFGPSFSLPRKCANHPLIACSAWSGGVGRAELLGGGGSSLKFLPGVGLGRGVKFLRYSLEAAGGGGGGPGNLETPLATPLWSTASYQHPAVDPHMPMYTHRNPLYI